MLMKKGTITRPVDVPFILLRVINYLFRGESRENNK